MPGATAPGRFITLEGGDGVGKSTQARLLCERLRAAGLPALATREPGGSELAEAIRDVLLAGKAAQAGPLGEALLFSAARIDHLRQVVRPALARGTWVVCDRFVDSTVAYQGMIGGVDLRLLGDLQRAVVEGTMPDLTLIVDVPASTALARATARRGTSAEPDRFERESRPFHQALRDAFRSIARDEPQRCVVVDGTGEPGVVADAIWTVVNGRLAGRSPVGDSA